MNLLIEGWRGVNHSYALVNQCQILEFLKIKDIRLFHRDLPFAMPHWNRTINDSGFPEADRQRIDALTEPDEARMDCIYRICSPFRASPPDQDCKTLTFMVTEFGLSPGNFTAESADKTLFTQNENRIITPTVWSRNRIIDYGFPADKILIIPHGVNTTIYYPSSEEERKLSRNNLGIAPDETVFLNLGVSTWNKGVDVLLLAFAQLCKQGLPARMILKDQQALYGISVMQVLKDVSSQNPTLFTSDVINRISVVSLNLSQTQLRLLYGIADCYVSPYRAEGFNLPVLEAIACGTPVIVTAGGATDDFCHEDVAIRIPGDLRDIQRIRNDQVGLYIEPRLPDLVEAMSSMIGGGGLDTQRQAVGRLRTLDACNWRHAAMELVNVAQGGTAQTVSLVTESLRTPVILGDEVLVTTISGRRNEVAILIPIFKPELSPQEHFAITHSMPYLDGHKTYFFCPVSLNLAYYKTNFQNIEFLRFDDSHFRSVRTYSALLINPTFYQRFLQFEYVLILQTDAVVLSNELPRWLESPYDYIGAPWPGGTEVAVDCGRFSGPYRRTFKPVVGNGGLSLRRVRACLHLLEELAALRRVFELSGEAEDLFFAVGGEISNHFIVPSEFVAARFAIEAAPEYYTAINNSLPFGVHAWRLYPEFWNDILSYK